MDRVGQFPQQEKPDNRYPHTDLQGELSYRELAERIDQFKLSVYQPSEYVTDPGAATGTERDPSAARTSTSRTVNASLVGMMRTNFLQATGKLGPFANADAGTHH